MPPSQGHTGTWMLHSSASATVSRPHRHLDVTQLCQCHRLKATQAPGCYTALSVPLSQGHTGMSALHSSVSATVSRPHRHLTQLCQCHRLKATQAPGCYIALSATVSRPQAPGCYIALSVPPSQGHTGTSTLHSSVSATVSRPHRHLDVT